MLKTGALFTQAPGVTGRLRSALLATRWIAGLADQRGTLEGLARIAAAHVLLARTDDLAVGSTDQAEQALALAEAAWLADPADPAKARFLGAVRQAYQNGTGARNAWCKALAIDPGMVKAARGLTDCVAKDEGPAAALALAEHLALATPTSRQLWDLAANRALAAGQPA